MFFGAQRRRGNNNNEYNKAKGNSSNFASAQAMLSDFACESSAQHTYGLYIHMCMCMYVCVCVSEYMRTCKDMYDSKNKQ